MEFDVTTLSEKSVNKKSNARKMIEQYYHMLTKGCNNPECTNMNCARANQTTVTDANEAAAKALTLFKSRAPLCQPDKHSEPEAMEVDIPGPVMGPSTSCSSNTVKKMVSLNKEKLDKIIKECTASGNFSELKQTLWDVFSTQDSVANSWLLEGSTQSVPPEVKCGDAKTKLTKEQLRQMEGETDKDVDSSQQTNQQEDKEMEDGEEKEKAKEIEPQCTLDLVSLRESYETLFALDNSIFESGLVNALVMLCSNLEMDLKCRPNIAQEFSFVNMYCIVFELPVLGCEAYLENVVPVLCRGVALLPTNHQVVLARIWSQFSMAKLKSLLENLQQILSLKVYTGAFTRDRIINQDETITSVTTVIRIVFYASLLASDRDGPDSWDTTDLEPGDPDQDHFSSADLVPKSIRERYHDPLGALLRISPLDVRTPLIPLTEFYNEPLNETIEMDQDFSSWKAKPAGSKFSFMTHPYILNPATKAQALFYDNRIRMYSERRFNLLQNMIGFTQSTPYLKLSVRRDHLIEDSLMELEMVVMENPQDLKKQLVVEFDSEQGIDEGGLSKEFFQLIVEEMFNPDIGMFIHDTESHTFWFNPTSYETKEQFTLIGIILGLAIYNNVILDLHLPSVIYSKLSGKRGIFHDLKDFKPTVYASLVSMLQYEEDDFTDVFIQPFQISYTDLFGTTITQDLCEGGENRMVTRENVQEYVDRYADFLLNKNVEQQFLAFQRGFDLVTSESPLNIMFNPTELEMLICGEKEFDFNDLENSTEYDGGYTKDTPVVRWFWQTVHAMSLEDKRKLLQFTTGSDRIPVGGLSRLKLMITKNGVDSDRLPSAHTCFNVLLLPEYSDKQKLGNLLAKAISECKGFGML